MEGKTHIRVSTYAHEILTSNKRPHESTAAVLDRVLTSYEAHGHKREIVNALHELQQTLKKNVHQDFIYPIEALKPLIFKVMAMSDMEERADVAALLQEKIKGVLTLTLTLTSPKLVEVKEE